MTRSFVLACFVTLAAAGALRPGPVHAQAETPLGGVWTLNRPQSEFPADIGFNPSWVSAARGDTSGTGRSGGSGGGGGGRRGGGRGSSGGSSSGGTGPFAAKPESYDDARRVQLLNSEARNPPARLMIVDTPSAVTITNELGQSRVLHPDGRKDSIEIQGVPIAVTAQRDGDKLVAVYQVEQGRELRYTFTHPASPSQLVVELQFLEHGTGDKARRVYDAGVENATTAAAGAPGGPPPTGPTGPNGKPAEKFDQRPGAELRGLTSLGILIEDLSSQAIACGLNHDALENALSRRLTEGGFTVRRNSDEDTYLYVNIMTNRLGDGTCVSRYDAFLYSHATATLSFHDQPVLVQASLIHRGGIGSSTAAAHPVAVSRGLQDYVDVFVTQIHDANK
jgi:hypothetical protein